MENSSEPQPPRAWCAIIRLAQLPSKTPEAGNLELGKTEAETASGNNVNNLHGFAGSILSDLPFDLNQQTITLRSSDQATHLQRA